MSEAETLRLVLPPLIVLAHVIVPLFFLLWLGLSRAKSRIYQLGVAVITVAGVVATLIAGDGWDWVGYPLRWVLGFGLLPALGGAALRWRKIGWRPEPGDKKAWVSIALVGALGLFFAGDLVRDVVSVLGARDHGPGARALTFPLRGGRFVIGNGGADETVNGHYAVRAQRYALDVSALNDWGARASGLYPRELSAYEVYGADVVAPCAGTVAVAVDGLPDLEPGEMDPDHLAGNHVILHCDGATILLAHLQPGSVAVDEGATVEPGDDVGRVGNTGNTSEPHLHVHAVRGLHTEIDRVAGDADPLPMTFDGRFLIRHDVVER